ncbi:MAG TPA: hypothetical protein VIL71_11345 [Spirillospora sp.]
MSDKPGKDKATVDGEPERDERPPRTQARAADEGRQKKKPGDAARKMRAMYSAMYKG